MADALEQSEVDALLAAVENVGQGDADVGIDESETSRQPQKETVIYDFKRPERISKDQMRALEAIHEVFARNFGATLSAFLRTIVEVRITGTEQVTYGEFVSSLPIPTCFNVLTAKPLEGSMCLEISPMIIFPIIDRLLGGGSCEAFIPQRALTTIELRLVSRILERALAQLSDAWSSLTPVQFELAETESNPQLVHVVTPNEVVIAVNFELQLGKKVGNMCLCLPYTTFEPLLGKMATQNWLIYKQKGTGENTAQIVANNVMAATVSLRAFLAETTLTVGQLIDLAVDDVIQTEKRADGELILQVEGKNKFAGRLAQYRGNRAIKITRLAEPDEHL